MKQRRWTDQEILDALRYWALRYGRPPKWSDWARADPEGLRPTNMTVWSRCGGWNDALVMAGLEPTSPTRAVRGVQKFSRVEARRLRREGLNDTQISEELGVHHSTIAKVLGKRPRPPKQPRTAAERREARIAALKKAVGGE